MMKRCKVADFKTIGVRTESAQSLARDLAIEAIEICAPTVERSNENFVNVISLLRYLRSMCPIRRATEDRQTAFGRNEYRQLSSAIPSYVSSVDSHLLYITHTLNTLLPGYTSAWCSVCSSDVTIDYLSLVWRLDLSTAKLAGGVKLWWAYQRSLGDRRFVIHDLVPRRAAWQSSTK